jgi:hypothetical protein
MREKVRLGVLCVFLAGLLVGCDWISSLFWQKVALSDATDAVTAIMNANQACIDTCTVDAGSTDTLGRAKNAEGTLNIEWSKPVSTYPRTRKYIYNGYAEAVTGYVLTGTVYVTWNSTDPQTCNVDVSMTHDTKPVRRVEGDLTETGSTPAGDLKVNNDTFPIGQFTSEYFFSH